MSKAKVSKPVARAPKANKRRDMLAKSWAVASFVGNVTYKVCVVVLLLEIATSNAFIANATAVILSYVGAI